MGGTKKFLELGEDETNLESACAGHIKQILDIKRTKYTNSFDHTFKVYEMHVKIHPMWREKDKASGYPKWQQAIRNVAKVRRKQRTPDALTQGELMALEHGGFALPHHVPVGRKVVKFPDLGGFDIPIVAKNKKPDPKARANALAEKFIVEMEAFGAAVREFSEAFDIAQKKRRPKGRGTP